MREDCERGGSKAAKRGLPRKWRIYSRVTSCLLLWALMLSQPVVCKQQDLHASHPTSAAFLSLCDHLQCERAVWVPGVPCSARGVTMQAAQGAAGPQPTPPPPGPMDAITAIQLQLQTMCKTAADCIEASTKHGEVDSVVIDTKVGAWRH